MYYVLAGNQRIAERWAIQKGVRPREIKRIYTTQDVLVLPEGAKVIFTCHYRDNDGWGEIYERLLALNILPLFESCCDREVG